MVKNFKNISVISTGAWVPTDLDKQKKSKKTYKILINELVLNAFIGIHEFEKKKNRKFQYQLL